MAKRAVKTHDLSCNITTVRRFLNALNRDWLHVYAIDPNNPDRSKVHGYVGDGTDDAADKVEDWQQRGWGTYFAVNTPSNKQAKKATKNELKWLWGVHIDMDLPKEVDRQSEKADALISAMVKRLQNDTLVPGVPMIVMSGNGVQAFWWFDEPIKATDENLSRVETINKQLAKHFGAPAGTHNGERIMRIPGGVNYPNAAKLKRGCAPVLSVLVCEADRDFDLSDFDRLPKMDPVTIRETATLTDYRARRYRDWSPYRWSDVMRALPQAHNEVVAIYRGEEYEHDRSRAIWTLISQIVDFLILELDEQPEAWLDDDDIKRNIMELCYEAREEHGVIDEVMGHIDDHEYGAAKLGSDVQRCLNSYADRNAGPSVRRTAEAQKQQEVAAIDAKPEDAVTVLEATKAFIAWVENSTPKDHMPNARVGATGPATSQPGTLANVRHVLAKSAITARWDAMKDEPRFTVSATDGLGGANPQRPAFNWGRALSRAGADGRSAAEIELLCDAMAQCGMTDRRQLEGFLIDIALEDQFHPLEDYATATRWDGEDRIGELANMLETEHPLARRYLEVCLFQCVGAVASLRQYRRTREGHQLSSTVVLLGAQGVGKSTFWRKLAPPGMMAAGRSLQLGGPKEADSMAACLSGVLCELGEIGQSMRRSEADALKDFQSGTVDTYRPAYAKRRVTKPRMTAFVGTGNADFQLTDITGSRRYLTMTVTWINWKALNAATGDPVWLQQLWAQAWAAVMLDGRGKAETWTLTAEEDRMRERENETHQAVTSEQGGLDEYMASVGRVHQPQWLTVTQVCKLVGVPYAPSRAPALTAALKAHGLEYRAKVRQGSNVLQKVWALPVTPERMNEMLTLRK